MINLYTRIWILHLAFFTPDKYSLPGRLIIITIYGSSEALIVD